MRIILLIIVAMLFCGAGTFTADAQQPAPATSQTTKTLKLRDHHGWGRFPAGSWRRVRVTKETFDDKGEVTSVSLTQSKTTLQMAASYAFELLTESTIEVAGQRYVPAPQKSKRDYYGVPREAIIKHVRESEFVLNGVKQKCQVFEVVINGGEGKSKRVTRFHVAQDEPVILRQETVSTSADGQKQFEINVDVVAARMPIKVLADTMPCSFLRTVQETVDKRVITIETYSKQVPGGVVRQSVKVLNKEGRMIERHTAELVDYGRVPMKSTSTTTPVRNRVIRRRPRNP